MDHRDDLDHISQGNRCTVRAWAEFSHQALGKMALYCDTRTQACPEKGNSRGIASAHAVIANLACPWRGLTEAISAVERVVLVVVVRLRGFENFSTHTKFVNRSSPRTNLPSGAIECVSCVDEMLVKGICRNGKSLF